MSCSNPLCIIPDDETTQTRTVPNLIYYDISDDLKPSSSPEDTTLTSVFFKQTKVFAWDTVAQDWVEIRS